MIFQLGTYLVMNFYMKSILAFFMCALSFSALATTLKEEFPSNLAKLNQYKEIEKRRYEAATVGEVVVVEPSKPTPQMVYSGAVPRVFFGKIIDRKNGQVLVQEIRTLLPPTWVGMDKVRLPVEQMRLQSGSVIVSGSAVQVVGRASYDGAIHAPHVQFVSGKALSLYERNIAVVSTEESPFPLVYSMELARVVSKPAVSDCKISLK